MAKSIISNNPAQLVTKARANLTDWSSYTPTFQGFSGVTSNLEYRIDGSDLLIKGDFDPTSSSAVEAQISLPIHNGQQLTVKTGLPTTTAGVYFIDNTATAHGGSILVTGGEAYFKLGADGTFGSSSINATNAINGNGGSSPNNRKTVEVRIPVNELSGSDVTFLAAQPTQRVAYIKDVKASGSNGGTNSAAAGYETRDLNTLSGDTEFVSLALNQFTLQPGKYEIEWYAPARGVDQHKAKLRDITNSADIEYGSCEIANASSQHVTTSRGFASIEIGAETTYEIQHDTVTNGTWGVAFSNGDPQIFTQVKITKLK